MPPAQPDSIRHLLLRHIARYPRSEVQDTFKWLFQGCCGPEHALVDAAAAARRLQEELSTCAEIELEPAIEPLPPHGQFVRLHLRPYAARGGELGELAAAFVRSARQVNGAADCVATHWPDVVALADQDLLPFTAGEAQKFWASHVAAGCPVVRHSERYRTSYAPAYRVLLEPEAQRLLIGRG